MTKLRIKNGNCSTKRLRSGSDVFTSGRAASMINPVHNRVFRPFLPVAQPSVPESHSSPNSWRGTAEGTPLSMNQMPPLVPCGSGSGIASRPALSYTCHTASRYLSAPPTLSPLEPRGPSSFYDVSEFQGLPLIESSTQERPETLMSLVPFEKSTCVNPEAFTNELRKENQETYVESAEMATVMPFATPSNTGTSTSSSVVHIQDSPTAAQSALVTHDMQKFISGSAAKDCKVESDVGNVKAITIVEDGLIRWPEMDPSMSELEQLQLQISRDDFGNQIGHLQSKIRASPKSNPTARLVRVIVDGLKNNKAADALVAQAAIKNLLEYANLVRQHNSSDAALRVRRDGLRKMLAKHKAKHDQHSAAREKKENAVKQRELHLQKLKRGKEDIEKWKEEIARLSELVAEEEARQKELAEVDIPACERAIGEAGFSPEALRRAEADLRNAEDELREVEAKLLSEVEELRSRRDAASEAVLRLKF